MIIKSKLGALSENSATGWRHSLRAFFGVMICTGFLAQGLAQATLESVVPAKNATGVSPSSSVVFTFSKGMNTDPTSTMAMFLQMPDYSVVPMLSAWDPTSKILTCTPIAPLSAGKQIFWMIEGEDADGESVQELGYFTVATGATPTNTMSSFTLGKGVMYSQTSTGTPSLQTNQPFAFVACTTLSGTNSDVTNVVITVPGSRRENVDADPALAFLLHRFGLHGRNSGQHLPQWSLLIF